MVVFLLLFDLGPEFRLGRFDQVDGPIAPIVVQEACAGVKTVISSAARISVRNSIFYSLIHGLSLVRHQRT